MYNTKVDKKNRVAVASRSFSKHPVLREALLSKYSRVTFNDDGLSLNGDSLVSFLKGHNKVITALERIDENVLSQLPELEVVGKYGVGLDMIDLHAMDQYGVKLGWTGGVNKRSVFELVISFSIALLHRTVFANAEVKQGQWYQVKGRQLSDCTIGIVGCGHIGKDLVKLLANFNCQILVNDILSFPEFYKRNNVTPVALEDLLKQSDVVTLHLPYDETTKNIINGHNMKLLKKDAIIINLARGGLIDEVALKTILKEKKIAGAALDVFAIEPPEDNELLQLDNVLVTPHIGGSTEEAIVAMGMAAINGLDNAKSPLEFI